MRWLVVLVIWFSVVAAGCSHQGATSVDAPYFEGLDQTVVGEVLNDPVALQKIEEEPSDTRESMAQGIVINFMVCRDALRVYQGWRNTGVAPSLEPLPTPTNPREPSYSDWITSYANLETRVDSGELEQLRFWLTAEGSCGRWIPARPGDVSGPTIRDVVEGES